MRFRGNIVALAAPFRNGKVDRAALDALVARCVQGEVSGVTSCGTTGESPTLTQECRGAGPRDCGPPRGAPDIQAIKEATGDTENVTRARSATTLSVLSGDDGLTLPVLALGGSGAISAARKRLPEWMTRPVAAGLRRGVHDRRFPLMTALFLDTNPVPIKEALAAVGWIAREFRLPLCPIDDTTLAVLHQALAAFREELQIREPQP